MIERIDARVLPPPSPELAVGALAATMSACPKPPEPFAIVCANGSFLLAIDDIFGPDVRSNPRVLQALRENGKLTRHAPTK